MKDLLLRTLMLPPASSILRSLMRDRGTIFFLHRFATPENDGIGHSLDRLRDALEYLRGEDFELISLREMLERMEGGRPLQGAVAFTIDDGYREQARVAAPLFAKYDCPVTTFVCTGFLDGQLWMWWDKVEYAMRECERQQFEFELAGQRHHYAWRNQAERVHAFENVTEACKLVSEAERLAAIDAIADACEVTLPKAPPEIYAPMSWDDVREAERLGMRFGPHTETHPILSRVSNEQSRREITGSWQRVQDECTDPEPVFCYPNGRSIDFGPRECDVVQELGMKAGLGVTPGYASPALDSRERFAIPRFGCPEDVPTLASCVMGIERYKEWLRPSEEASWMGLAAGATTQSS